MSMESGRSADFNWDDFKETLELDDSERAQLEFTAELIHTIVQRREELNISQRDLGEKSGVRHSTIARIENGQVVPKIDTLFKIAYALDIRLLLAIDEHAATA